MIFNTAAGGGKSLNAMPTSQQFDLRGYLPAKGVYPTTFSAEQVTGCVIGADEYITVSGSTALHYKSGALTDTFALPTAPASAVSSTCVCAYKESNGDVIIGYNPQTGKFRVCRFGNGSVKSVELKTDAYGLDYAVFDGETWFGAPAPTAGIATLTVYKATIDWDTAEVGFGDGVDLETGHGTYNTRINAAFPGRIMVSGSDSFNSTLRICDPLTGAILSEHYDSGNSGFATLAGFGAKGVGSVCVSPYPSTIFSDTKYINGGGSSGLQTYYGSVSQSSKSSTTAAVWDLHATGNENAFIEYTSTTRYAYPNNLKASISYPALGVAVDGIYSPNTPLE